MTQNDKAIRITSAANARQLGGYVGLGGRRVRDNVLLRCGHLGALSEKDAETLSSVYRLGHIIDLRSSVERAGSDDKPVPHAVYENIRIMDETALQSSSSEISVPKDTPEGLLTFIKAVDRLNVFHDDMYIEFLENEFGIMGYRRFFDILLSAERERAVLWHCASGKDRTGLAAMLILTVLGVDEDTIIADYMLTNEFNREHIAQTQALILRSDCDDRLAENIALFGGVHERYMTIALDHLKTKYGSVMGYIKNALLLTDEDIEALQSKYLA